MAAIVLLISIGILLVYIFAAIEFGKAAEEKGYPEKKTTVIALCILFPFAGYLLSCALPDKKGRNGEETDAIISARLPDL